MNAPHKITATEIVAEAWANPARTPRSREYRDGMLALLRYQLEEIHTCHCPHTAGTTAYDAWYAGVAEAWAQLNVHGVAPRRTA